MLTTKKSFTAMTGAVKMMNTTAKENVSPMELKRTTATPLLPMETTSLTPRLAAVKKSAVKVTNPGFLSLYLLCFGYCHP